MQPPLAITGLGLTTSLGAGAGENWRRLAAGESGLRPLRAIDVRDYPIQDGGEDPEAPDGEPFPGGDPSPPELRRLLGACREALGGAAAPGDPERIGLAVGSSLAASSTSEEFFRDLLERGPEEADHGILEGCYIERHLAWLLAGLGIRGPALLVSNACAAGASAVARAAGWIRSGRCDAAIAAGYDAFSIFTFAGFGSLQALSRAGVRPFSARRDGMLLGAGYAAMVLEPLERARAAGRAPIALLLGCGESSDAHHLTHPHPQGLGAALAMRRALAEAGIGPDSIDAINCHGTATRSNDSAEARAMRAVFGERLPSIPVFASKPAVGHTLGGAGAVEAAICALALRAQFLPPTLGAEAADPEFGPLDLVPEGRPARLRRVMSNAFGFGGSNASLVLGAADAPGREGGRHGG